MSADKLFRMLLNYYFKMYLFLYSSLYIKSLRRRKHKISRRKHKILFTTFEEESTNIYVLFSTQEKYSLNESVG